jgi:isoamylase
VLCLGVVFVGYSSDVTDAKGEPIHDESFMMLFNAYHAPVKFILAGREGIGWERLIDTQLECGFLEHPDAWDAGDEFEVESRSMCVFRHVRGTVEDARSAAWRPRQTLVAD